MGKQGHGLKKGRSTLTLGLKIQSLIARVLDEDNYAIMASLDLSAVFDVVNISLLIKRLKILGLPADVIDLIKVWLRNRSLYVSIDYHISVLFDIICGTVQGSFLGPKLYGIYVSPFLDLIIMSSFADDNFAVRWNRDKNELIKDLQKNLETLTKWLSDSRLNVIENKPNQYCCTVKIVEG
jgi:hypothetical protein